MTAPLAPYRVLDLTTADGWLCGKLLADLGADVVKVEPPGGDPGRRLGPFARSRDGDPEANLAWWFANRGKRSVVADLADPADTTFEGLLPAVDVVIESFGAGGLAGARLVAGGADRPPPAPGGHLDLALRPGRPLPGPPGTGPRRRRAERADVADRRSRPPAAAHQQRPAVPPRLRRSRRAHDGGAPPRGPHRARPARRRLGAGGRGAHDDERRRLPRCSRATRSRGSAPASPTHRGARARSSPAPTATSRFMAAIGPLGGPGLASAAPAGGPGRRRRADAPCATPTSASSATGSWRRRAGPSGSSSIWRRWSRACSPPAPRSELYTMALEHLLFLAPINTVADLRLDEQLAVRRYWQPVDQGPDVGTVTFPGPWARLSRTPLLDTARAPHVGEHDGADPGRARPGGRPEHTAAHRRSRHRPVRGPEGLGHVLGRGRAAHRPLPGRLRGHGRAPRQQPAGRRAPGRPAVRGRPARSEPLPVLRRLQRLEARGRHRSAARGGPGGGPPPGRLGRRGDRELHAPHAAGARARLRTAGGAQPVARDAVDLHAGPDRPPPRLPGLRAAHGVAGRASTRSPAGPTGTRR